MDSEENISKENQIRILNTLKHTELELKVVLLNKKFKIAELISLGPGSVLDFATPTDTPAVLTINNQPFAEGTIVQVDDHYGLQIN